MSPHYNTAWFTKHWISSTALACILASGSSNRGKQFSIIVAFPLNRFARFRLVICFDVRDVRVPFVRDFL
jgi:hypothetical protein